MQVPLSFPNFTVAAPRFRKQKLSAIAFWYVVSISANMGRAPEIPKRRVKSKNFLMKVIGGRGSIRKAPAVEHDNVDAPIDDTPTRRASGRSIISASIYEGSTLNTIIPSAFVICPEIKITPEVQSMESGPCTLWIGISVAAKLSRADGEPGYMSSMTRFGM